LDVAKQFFAASSNSRAKDDTEATLKPIRQLPETIRERVDYAISRLKLF
jgi:hypothetical protein